MVRPGFEWDPGNQLVGSRNDNQGSGIGGEGFANRSGGSCNQRGGFANRGGGSGRSGRGFARRGDGFGRRGRGCAIGGGGFLKCGRGLRGWRWRWAGSGKGLAAEVGGSRERVASVVRRGRRRDRIFAMCRHLARSEPRNFRRGVASSLIDAALARSAIRESQVVRALRATLRAPARTVRSRSHMADYIVDPSALTIFCRWRAWVMASSSALWWVPLRSSSISGRKPLSVR